MSTFWTPTMQTYYQQLQNLQDFSTVDQDQGVTRLDRRITAAPDGHFDPLIAAFEGHDPQPRVVHIQAPAHFSPQNDAQQQALAVRQTMGILNVNLAPNGHRRNTLHRSPDYRLPAALCRSAPMPDFPPRRRFYRRFGCCGGQFL